MKRTIALVLVILSLCTIGASAATMYAPDGRTAQVHEYDVPAWRAVGWYTEPVTTVYALDGRQCVIAKSQLAAWQSVGWYTYPGLLLAQIDVEVSKSGYEAGIRAAEALINSHSDEAIKVVLAAKGVALCNAWYSTDWCPLKICAYYAGLDESGKSCGIVEVRNVSGKDIESIRIANNLYTTSGTNYFDKTGYMSIGAYEGTAIYETLESGYGARLHVTRVGQPVIEKVVFTDGTVWYR